MKSTFYLKLLKIASLLLLIFVIFIVLKQNFFNVYEGADTLTDKQKELQAIAEKFTGDLRNRLRIIIKKKSEEANAITQTLINEFNNETQNIDNGIVDTPGDEEQKIASLKNKFETIISNYEMTIKENVQKGITRDFGDLTDKKIRGIINNYI